MTRSREYIRETCPKVDEIFEDLAGKLEDLVAPQLFSKVEELVNETCQELKDEVTYKFRDALDSCCSDLDDAEAKVNELEEKVSDLESQL